MWLQASIGSDQLQPVKHINDCGNFKDEEWHQCTGRSSKDIIGHGDEVCGIIQVITFVLEMIASLREIFTGKWCSNCTKMEKYLAHTGLEQEETTWTQFDKENLGNYVRKCIYVNFMEICYYPISK